MDDNNPSKNITSNSSSNTNVSNLASMIAALVLFGFAMGAMALNTYLERRKTVKSLDLELPVVESIAYAPDMTGGSESNESA
jgi:hypothetical protein